jgi:predicted nucleotidyltransferase
VTASAYLSARVSPIKKQAIRRIAASQGITVQELVNRLVDEFVAKAERRPPLLAEVVQRLRAHHQELRRRGVRALFVFGSVARGGATPASDIDLAVVFAPAARVSLVSLGSLKAYLEQVLGWPVDLGERGSLRPEARAAFDREAVRVFG